MAGRMAPPDSHLADDRGLPAIHAPGPWFQKIVLSFDGGGVRGYWSLLVLQHLMREIRRFEIAEDPRTQSSFHPCQRPDFVSHLVGANNVDNPTEYTPYLPCHYFDYIGGTSTGALIAILLSRFRMTVEDCLREYETMAGTIFGYPRVFHQMNALVPLKKYPTKHLEKAIKEVIDRRVQVRLEDDREPLFQTEIDTCRGVVLATQLDPVNRANRRFLFRSYTPFSERSRRNAQGGELLSHRNPGEGIRISLLKVALAGTAAPFYFGHYHTVLSTAQAQSAAGVSTERGTRLFEDANGQAEGQQRHLAEGKSPYQFEDAGFSRDNNPCNQLYREVVYNHGEDSTPVLVSIGTARPKDDYVGEGVLTTIRRGLHQLGNPEEVHEEMLLRSDQDRVYYRLNDDNGIEIEMDEWKPKKVGSDTIAKMRTKFDAWLRQDGVGARFEACARHLVRLRRGRMTTPRWERFALGQYFVCLVQNCPKDRDNQWLDREDFENHLRREHVEEDYDGDLDAEVQRCQQMWRYRQRAAPS
ncbi:acyl transferase/acyl hydrolase/lysophospholipase [Xylaria palmicola]|nr:acyl transferase/acyl hydrolase/lysophospholipase [Xylaria palmicola]